MATIEKEPRTFTDEQMERLRRIGEGILQPHLSRYWKAEFKAQGHDLDILRKQIIKIHKIDLIANKDQPGEMIVEFEDDALGLTMTALETLKKLKYVSITVTRFDGMEVPVRVHQIHDFGTSYKTTVESISASGFDYSGVDPRYHVSTFTVKIRYENISTSSMLPT